MNELAIPPKELDDLAALPAKWRKYFDNWRTALENLNAGLLTKVEVCSRLDVNRATVDRKIAAVKLHGWRGLIPNYKAPTRLTDAFIDYWKTLQESYQRNTAAAYRELVRRWRDRHPIPGYTGHPGWPELPDGWTSRNLYEYQPTKLELTALRHGTGRAILLHAPKVLSTRVGLWHLSHILADDVKLDMKGHILTSRQMVVPLQIGFMDLLSANRFLHGTKPQLLRDNGTKTGLSEAEMRFMLASQLYNHGISARGTTYVLEHGTATLRDRVMEIMQRAFGDKVTFHLSGMTGKMQAIAGMGDGKGGGGNFLHKAALESLHSYMHNELAALPAQTGHDRDEPEYLGVIKRENEQLFALYKRLPSEVLADLQYPTLEFHTQLIPTVNRILQIINERTEHNLEGWAELQFLTRSYRLAADSQEWKTDQDLMLMPPPVKAAYLHMAEQDKRCFLPRKLSPHEVFQRGVQAGEVIKVPHGVIAEILYDDLAQARKCRDGYFTFTDQNIAPSELNFEARVIRPDGQQEELRDRETYEVVVNPFDLSRLWVFSGRNAKGGFLGTALRTERLTRTNQEARERFLGRVNERLAEQFTDSRRRNSGRTQAIAERRSHNASVIAKHQAAQLADTRKGTEALNASHSDASTNTTSTTKPRAFDARHDF